MSPNRQDNLSVDDLLARWQQSQNDGATMSVEQLCAGQPNLREDLEQRLRGLASMRAFLQLSDAPRCRLPRGAGIAETYHSRAD